jgi:ubiquinone/menaquinone biosynthesis C-methylase UbiE
MMTWRNRRINEWVIARLDLRPADHVLEIAFGTGRAIAIAARQVPQGLVAGIECSSEMVKQATQRNRAAILDGQVELRQGALDGFPYGDDLFDKTFGVDVISYLSDPMATLREVWRVLKPGGMLALMVHKPDVMPRNPVLRAASSYTLYTGQEVVTLLKQAGFSRAWVEDSARDETAFAALGIK